jgi:hypothetical protein
MYAWVFAKQKPTANKWHGCRISRSFAKQNSERPNRYAVWPAQGIGGAQFPVIGAANNREWSVASEACLSGTPESPVFCGAWRRKKCAQMNGFNRAGI